MYPMGLWRCDGRGRGGGRVRPTNVLPPPVRSCKEASLVDVDDAASYFCVARPKRVLTTRPLSKVYLVASEGKNRILKTKR